MQCIYLNAGQSIGHRVVSTSEMSDVGDEMGGFVEVTDLTWSIYHSHGVIWEGHGNDLFTTLTRPCDSRKLG